MAIYAKAIAALFGSVSTWGIAVAPDGINSAEWFGLLGVIGTVMAVYAIPNKTEGETNV